MDSQLLDLVSKIYIELQEMKADVKEMKSDIREMKSDMLSMKSDLLDIKYDFKEVSTPIDEINEGVKSLKEIQMRMERQFVGKLDALIDSREDQMDIDEKVVYNLQRVEHKIDKLELKIVKNIFSDK
ncbi:MAG: hypothetical protein ACRC1P_00525 [Cellulosilyticaceae bacterium]